MRITEQLLDGLVSPEKSPSTTDESDVEQPCKKKQTTSPKKSPHKGFILASNLSPACDYLDHSPERELSFSVPKSTPRLTPRLIDLTNKVLCLCVCVCVCVCVCMCVCVEGVCVCVCVCVCAWCLQSFERTKLGIIYIQSLFDSCILHIYYRQYKCHLW